MDNCSASAVESKHLDVKSGSALTNSKEDWLIQLLLREKRSDDTRVMSAALGQTEHVNGSRGIVSSYTMLSKFQQCTRQLDTRARLDSLWRNHQVLLLDCLGDKNNPWITGNPSGDMTHLSFALAKYVQDTLWREVSWIPAPSTQRADRLDMDMLGKLLKLVIDWDSSRARGGELAIYNNLVISVPVDEEWLQVRLWWTCVGMNHGTQEYFVGGRYDKGA